MLAGCASSPIETADRQSREGRYEAALATLDDAVARRPDDAAVRTAWQRQRDQVLAQLLARAEMALATGRLDEARSLQARAEQLMPAHPRLAALRRQLEAVPATSAAQALPSPGTSGAAALPAASAGASAAPRQLGPAFQRPVLLEFRDAPLRQVFEALARSTQVNFVFDRDVRADSRITVFLRQVSLDEALRVILATQGLDRKLLNESTVLVYPNSPVKQREHQELVARTFYLANADAKQVLSLVRTMVKTRDLHADERLNLLVVRDTPEVVQQVEQLLATLDLPEPEVMLAVEVLEVASSRLDELGLKWPSTISWGLPSAGSGPLVLNQRDSFVGYVANPAIVASLSGTDGTTNLLANPSIRVRSREKAKVHIGEKLPVFTTTSTANVGTSASVSYLDVGLKLDVEPTVQRDGDVTIRVGLEVSNVVREVAGPSSSLAYLVGTRSSSTVLRLRDGETQVLAGLINDEDRRSAKGVPGLASAPLIGRLFGAQSDTRNKTEVVMLITPRILRPLGSLPARQATIASGTDSQPGTAPLRLASPGRASLAPGRGSPPAPAAPAAPAAQAADAEPPAPPPPAAADAPAAAAAVAPEAAPALLLSATAQPRAGETASITLRNRSGLALSGELYFDADQLQPASGAAELPGRLSFKLPPGGEAVQVLRVARSAAGQQLLVQVARLAGTTAGGEAREVQAPADVMLQVRPAAQDGAAAAGGAPAPQEPRP